MAPSAPSADDVRKALLTVVGQSVRGIDNGFSREQCIKYAAQKLGNTFDPVIGCRIMDAWDDLYRAGIVGYGMNMANLGQDWAHLTEYGRAAVADLDRNPSNPAGYRSVVEPHLKDEPIAASYLGEALDTYNKGSFKASAVMLGCAAEALSLSLRDKLAAKITASGGTPPADLGKWMIARVLDATEKLLAARVAD